MATDDRLDDDDDRDRDRPRRRDRGSYEQEHRGGLILALGIIGLVACGPVGIISLGFCHRLAGRVFGIPAWMMGNSDLRGMADGEVDPEGKQLTQVGKILGIVGTIMSLLYTVGAIVYLVFVVAFVAAMPK